MAITSITRFKVYSPVVGGGESVKVKIRRDLTNPLSGNIGGILHIGATKVYIPENGQISIGSTRSCDIKIFDPRVAAEHVVIAHLGNEQFSLTNIATDESRPIYVKNGETIEVPSAMFESSTVDMLGKSAFSIPLSGVGEAGTKRYLEIGLDPLKEPAQELALHLAMVPIRPPIEEVSPEAILARMKTDEAALSQLAQEYGLAVTKPLDQAIVAGTPFEAARTTDSLFDLIKNQGKKMATLSRFRKREGKIVVIPLPPAIAGIVISGVSVLLGGELPLWLLDFSMLSIGLGSLVGLGGTVAEIYRRSLHRSIVSVLAELSDQEISRQIIREKAQWRESLLNCLPKERQEAVKRKLSAGTDQTVLPEAEEAPKQLPEATEGE